jgi:hypothetical protein
LDADFFAGVSLALAFDRHQHLLLTTRRLPRLFRGLRRLCRFRGADAPTQHLHQIDDVAAGGAILFGDRLAGALLIDEVDQRGLVLVLKLVRLEPPSHLVHDVLGQVEHVFRDFDVLDLIEIFLF